MFCNVVSGHLLKYHCFVFGFATILRSYHFRIYVYNQWAYAFGYFIIIAWQLYISTTQFAHARSARTRPPRKRRKLVDAPWCTTKRSPFCCIRIRVWLPPTAPTPFTLVFQVYGLSVSTWRQSIMLISVRGGCDARVTRNLRV